MKKLILTALLCVTIINPAKSAYSGYKTQYICINPQKICSIQNINTNKADDIKCFLTGEKEKKEEKMCKIQK